MTRLTSARFVSFAPPSAAIHRTRLCLRVGFCKAFDADRGTGCHAIALHRRRWGRIGRRHLGARRGRLCLCGFSWCGCHHERSLAVIVSMFLVVRKNAHTMFNSSLNDSDGCTSIAFFMGYNYGCESDACRVKCLESIILLHFKKLDYLPDRDAAPLAGVVVIVTGNVSRRCWSRLSLR